MWVLGVDTQARILVGFAQRCLEWILLFLRMGEAAVSRQTAGQSGALALHGWEETTQLGAGGLWQSDWSQAPSQSWVLCRIGDQLQRWDLGKGV